MQAHRLRVAALVPLAALLVLPACGDGGGDPGPSPLVIAKATGGNGDNQTGAPGEDLKDGLRIIITREGAPVADVGVDFATGNGGSLEPADATTNDDGIAESFWTLGPAEGQQTATASVTGATGSPVTFTATADNGAGGGGASVQVLGPDGGNRFSPAALTVGVGETVTWTWPAGSQNHNVSPDAGTPTRSGDLASGPKTYSFTFTTAGVYRYYCENHGGPGGQGMSGTITVNSPAP